MHGSRIREEINGEQQQLKTNHIGHKIAMLFYNIKYKDGNVMVRKQLFLL